MAYAPDPIGRSAQLSRQESSSSGIMPADSQFVLVQLPDDAWALAKALCRLDVGP